MNSDIFSCSRSRRDFFKKALILGSVGLLKPSGLLAFDPPEENGLESPQIFHKFKTMSVAHFKDLQEDIDKLRQHHKLSRNKIYRSYIDRLKFEIPETFPKAHSIIVMAVFTRAMFVKFHLTGKTYDTMLSPQYYDDGISLEDLKKVIQKEIVREPAVKIEQAKGLHLKLLAVRSGLGRYGRNNLCFIDGMGTFITLYAFYTDYQFKEDSWHDMDMLDACRDCQICFGICPTNAITRENFVIDAGKCITLYNEIDGKFPNWILPSMHNALMGCMKCQLRCPVNEGYIDSSGRFDDVTEEETRKILQGKADDDLFKSLSQKLKSFPPASSREYFPIFTRNLRVIISRGRIADAGQRARL
ncbi:MAG: 4Fe-4S double cluster binding domain-containing protein [Candidatus Aminicenantales bacterium]